MWIRLRCSVLLVPEFAFDYAGDGPVTPVSNEQVPPFYEPQYRRGSGGNTRAGPPMLPRGGVGGGINDSTQVSGGSSGTQGAPRAPWCIGRHHLTLGNHLGRNWGEC